VQSDAIPLRALENSIASVEALLPFLPQGREQLFRTATGITAVLQVLDRTQHEIKTSGAPSLTTRDALVRCFGDEVALLEAHEIGQEEPDKIHPVLNGNEPSETSQRWLAWIEQRRADCVVVKKCLEVQRESEIEAEIAAASIPPKAVLKNIIRYTREIRRQIDWYERKLADAQACRKANGTSDIRQPAT
jgi:hypothetical protein